MRVIAGIKVIPDDLACRVDAGCNGAVDGQEVVEGGVIATAIQEAWPEALMPDGSVPLVPRESSRML